MKIIRGILLAAGILISPFTIQAQGTQSDSIVAVTANAYGLPLVSPEILPLYGGTYWEVLPGGIMAPLPCPPIDLTLPIYGISDRAFLVDLTVGSIGVAGSKSVSSDSLSAAVSKQGNAIANLIEQLQGNSLQQSMAMSFGLDVPTPGDGGGSVGDYTIYYSSSSSIDTNGLWLEITNVSNGFSYLNLHNATNQVYAIWGTPDLLLPWTVKTELWPTDTNCQPFFTANIGFGNLFLKAQDWTGVDSDGDGIPDWWLWMYFHTLDLNSTNLDSQGNTLGYDFTNNVDPNVIAFTVSATNQFFNQNDVPLQINVLAGLPAYFAVLANNPDTNNVNWQTYVGTNITATLGATDGVYSVSVGLRGYPESSQQTWQTLQVTRDTTPPSIVITNPTVNTTAQTMIQLQGYACEPLSGVSYDISNALAVACNQSGELTTRALDPKTGKFTTNYFQCLDIALAEGINNITLRAGDKAGNIAVTNFNITVDFSMATNPVVQVLWPPDGGQICNNNFTCYGRIDDPTAIVSARITDADGNTNLVDGQVERNGNFWVEYLPLAEGINYLTLAITNAAGYSTTTNLTLIQNTNVLAMNPPSADQLWQPFINVTGVVSDASCDVYVNDVKGVNNGDETWYALDVPTSIGGVACFNLSATLSGGSQAASSSSEFSAYAMNSPQQNPLILNNTNIDKPAYIYVSCYYIDWTKTYTMNSGNGPHPNVVIAPSDEHFHMFWQPDVNVKAYHTVSAPTGSCTNNYSWPPDRYILNYVSPSSNGILTRTCSTNVEVVGPPTILFEHGSYCSNYQATLNSKMTYQRNAQTVLVLHTGGKALSKKDNLFQINGSASALTNVTTMAFGDVQSTDIEMGVLGTLETNGVLWVAKPDNREFDMTPVVTATLNPDYYTFTAAQDKFKPKISRMGHGVVSDDNSHQIIVGEKCDLICQLVNASHDFPDGVKITNYLWTVPGYAVKNFYVSADTFRVFKEFRGYSLEAI